MEQKSRKSYEFPTKIWNSEFDSEMETRVKHIISYIISPKREWNTNK